ncbi:hypothetical protein EJ05DRAFT_468450 [Pseudovirgaria hyperparasitica]|uniref:PhoD-like phosphatase metallophosphatase domain-containing protein n=1 Tax=Pseudovirgaria hyperparasitica TaxID=470096 RepID=A0A6A6VY98_9PEZI|nr:uncharacterized protein EJ05DRAFT_468450 [Pseudovirgaria hyperparasitica]KAF2754684.1 hypothetical protein EJ05DRAFT_468450 [Pseudovirgaria hyperparasitica]
MPSTFVKYTALSSSVVLRLSTYVFLRWGVPPVLPALIGIYLTSFIAAFQETAPYRDIVRIIDTKEIITDSDGEDEAVEETETVVVAKVKPKPRVLRTLLTGLPSPTSSLWSYVTLFINIALVLMCYDHVYHGPLLHQAHDLAFIRVGYVSDSSAKLLVREPHLHQLPLTIKYRRLDPNASSDIGHFLGIDDGSWKTASTLEPSDLTDDTDYTATIKINWLSPDTRYQYMLSNNQTGHFTTAPRIGKTSKHTDGKYTFVHSSCIKPRVPYNPTDHPLHIPGFNHLASWIPKLQAHFMLFLGDFIYVDVPLRLGTDVGTYRQEYRQVYASPDWPAASHDLPWLHVIDDHEISNDWDKNTTGLYQSAIDPWHHYNAAVNPPASRAGHTWFEFNQGLASFFLMDTRRYRTTNSKNATDTRKSMLGDAQLFDLLQFLASPTPAGIHWKVIVSSIPFTKNWHFGGEDTWGGYLVERQKILEAMWDVGLKGGVGVIVLSGDRHEFAATAFPPPAGGKWPATSTVHEFSTSPLSMFYLPYRTYKQTDLEDVKIKYLPDGNSKFGAIEITNPDSSDQGLLTYRLIIDGKEAWTHTLTTPPSARVMRSQITL